MGAAEVRDAGIAGILAAATQRHPSSVKMMCTASDGLGAMAHSGNLEGEDAAGYIAAARQHLSESMVQVTACQVLQNVALRSRKDARDLIRLGAFDMSLAAAVEHRNCPRVQASACGLLAELISSSRSLPTASGNSPPLAAAEAATIILKAWLL